MQRQRLPAMNDNPCKAEFCTEQSSTQPTAVHPSNYRYTNRRVNRRGFLAAAKMLLRKNQQTHKEPVSLCSVEGLGVLSIFPKMCYRNQNVM